MTEDPFDLGLACAKAEFAAETEDEAYAVVGGPFGFEIYKRWVAREKWPDLIWYEAKPPY